MANKYSEFKLEELYPLASGFQTQVDIFRSKHRRGLGFKTEFESARAELEEIWIELLENRFERVCSSLKIAGEEPQPLQGRDSELVFDQGQNNFRIHIWVLRKKYPELFTKVREKMTTKVNVPVEVLYRGQWGTAVLTEKVPGAIERWGITEIKFDRDPEKSAYTMADIINCNISFKGGLFRPSIDPTNRVKFDEDFSLELIPANEVEIELGPKGFKPPVIIWGSTRNGRGAPTREKTPAGIKPDGFFANGTPYWRVSHQGHSGRTYPALVSTYDGIDVFGRQMQSMQMNASAPCPDWWMATVVPNFDGCFRLVKPKDYQGWTEATLEQLQARREQIKVEHEQAYQEFVVRQHYFPWMHTEVRRLSEILFGLDQAITRLS